MKTIKSLLSTLSLATILLSIWISPVQATYLRPYAVGDNLVYSDVADYSIADDATDANYKLMKSFTTSRSGDLRVKWEAYIQSGTYYWAYKITKNSTNTLSSGKFDNCDEACSVHAYSQFTDDIFGVDEGDIIELWMVSSDGSGNPVNGDGQNLYTKNFRVYSDIPGVEAINNNVWGERVGIGTTIPDGMLHIKESDANVGIPGASSKSLIIERNGNTGLSILSPNTNVGGIAFGDPEDLDVGLMQYSHVDDEFRFWINGTRQMIINSSGNVGIGTTTPENILHLSSNNPYQIIDAVNTGADKQGGFIFKHAGVNKWAVGPDSATGTGSPNFHFYSYGTANSVLTLNQANGNVGIGTTAPAAKLDVAGRIAQTGTGGSTFLGENAGLNDDLSDNYNVFIGANAGQSNTSGYQNSFLGTSAGYSNTTGSYNSFIGYGSGISNTVGNYNTALGVRSLYYNVANSRSTAIGHNAMYNADNRTTGQNTYNTAVGYEALKGSTTPANNTGQYNTAIGDSAGFSNTSGSYNSFLSHAAGLYNTAGSRNSFLGYAAGHFNTTGSYNIALGMYAGYYNTTGNNNSFLGYAAGHSNTTGSYNTALGMYAGYANITGSQNTALGYQAGRYIADGTTQNTISDNSVYLGYNTKALADDDQNEIVIGYDAIGAGSNSVVLGNDSITKTVLKGNVGIGVAAPNQALTVFGEGVSELGGTDRAVFRVGGAGGVKGVFIGYDNNEQLGMFHSNGGSSGFQFITHDGSSWGERLRIHTNGKVGIGTTAPNHKLQVVGDGYFTGNIGVGAGSSSAYKIYAAQSKTNTSNTRGVFASNNAISTANGTYYNIGVSADSRDIVNSGVSNSGYIMGADISGYLAGAGNIAGTYGARLDTGTYTGGTGTVTNAYGAMIRVLNQGSGTISNAYGAHIVGEDYSGTITNSYGVYIANMDGSTNSYGIYQNSANDKNYFAGNVGIGTTNPGTRLTVQSSDDTSANIARFDNTSGTGMFQFFMEADSSSALYMKDQDNNSDIVLRTNGNSYFSGGNVGIGTTAPEKTLQVVGDMKIGSGGSYDDVVMQTGADMTYNGVFEIMPRTIPGSGAAQHATYFKSNIGTGSTTHNVLIDGKVGIGTTAPAFNLDIYKATHNYARVASGGVTQDAAYISSDGTNSWYAGMLGSVAQNTWGVWQAGTGNGMRMLIDSTGKVGIGTTAPSQKLEVDGAILGGTEPWVSSVIGNNSGRMQLGATNGNAIIAIHDNTAVAADTGPSGIYFTGRTNDTGPAYGYLGIISARKENATQGNSASYMTFKTSDGSSIKEQVRITSAGKVGIGTTAPSAPLHIKDVGLLHDNIKIESTEAGSVSYLSLVTNSGSGQKEWNISHRGTAEAENNRLEFLYDGQYKMTITTAGNVGIGTTAPSAALHVNGQIIAAGGIYFAASADDSRRLQDSSNGSSSSTLYIGNAAIQTSSDRRLKKNITNTSMNALSKINQLNVVDFNWNDPSDIAINNRNSRGLWTGLIAQDVVRVLPFIVNAPRPEGKEIDYESEKTWLIEYQNMVPVIIKAIQELVAEKNTEIEELKNKNAELEKRLKILEEIVLSN